jgi:hypothetical protein
MTALAEYGDFYKKLTDNLMDPLQVQLHKLSLRMVANISSGELSEKLLHSPAMTRNRANIGFEVPRHQTITIQETSVPRIGILDERRIGGIAYDPFTMKKRSKRAVFPPATMTYGSTKQYELNKLVSPGLSLKDQDALQKFHKKQVMKQIQEVNELEKLTRKRDVAVQTYVDEYSTIPGMLPASSSRLADSPVSHYTIYDDDDYEDVHGRSIIKTPSSTRPSVSGPPDLLTETPPERAIIDASKNPFWVEVEAGPSRRKKRSTGLQEILDDPKNTIKSMSQMIRRYEPSFKGDKKKWIRPHVAEKYYNIIQDEKLDETVLSPGGLATRARRGS